MKLDISPGRTKYFPQGIVTEEFFCNRENERLELKKSIESSQHTVIVAPRRYGKTSLIAQVLKENQYYSANMDFFFVLEQADVCAIIADSVSKIISQILPKTKALYHKFVNSVMVSNPKMTFNILGQKIQIDSKQASEKNISELLLLLDQFASKAKKNCVIVFDEFQQIGTLKENHKIEAAIRHAVERSTNVSYIFSGSHRHLLGEMFNDKSRPLYHLCNLMTIDRIDEKSYQNFLNKMARKRWKQNLNKDVSAEILNLTERHPYYVSALARILWQSNNVPSIASTKQAWHEYAEQQASWITKDLTYLTLNRRKVLSALAKEPSKEILGHNFCRRVGLVPSNIKKSVTDLEKLDMVYVDKEGYYRVLDPLISYSLRR